MSTMTARTASETTLESYNVSGYEYIHRIVAPRTVEFFAPTPQGHRIVRVYLDSHNPRITAFNETNYTRTPATLFLQEVLDLIEHANKIVSSSSSSDTDQQKGSS